MTYSSKINTIQKNLLAEFMKDHPDLAKNILPNCLEGKTMALRLWSELANKLNAVGPPVKDAKIWRKVYADQKYQAKKKLSHNKAAKWKTAGEAYEQKYLSTAEEQILEASGLDVAVESIKNAKAFGVTQHFEENSKASFHLTDSEVNFICSSDDSVELPSCSRKTESKQSRNSQEDEKCSVFSDCKSSLLQENLEFRKEINQKVDRLLDIQERLLKMKEEEHEATMAAKKVELKIKTLKLELLKSHLKTS